MRSGTDFLRTHRSLPALGSSCVLDFALAGCTSTVAFTGSSEVSGTNNPLVAKYSVMGTEKPATVYIQFGPTPQYGLRTWPQSTSADGRPLNLLVAGMRANSTYHMRAVVRYADGRTATDADHTFTTGTFQTQILPTMNVTTPEASPAGNGIELIDATLSPTPGYLEAFATDLAGNIVWGYDYPDRDANSIIQPIKPLTNGDFALIISFASQFVGQPALESKTNTLREIDLAGNTVRDLPLYELNRRMKAAGYTMTLLDYHHDFTVLPNGHWLVLANLTRDYSDLPGFPGTTHVLGDVVIDLDPNWNPVWVWNEFDHLDVNRHPMAFPDWTHTNATVYSPVDGDLLISMRHQNWIVKVDYADGAGTGNVVWRLGQGGDFQLLNGTDPTDWFYAQHAPAIRAGQTNSRMELSVMDNGDDRMFPGGVQCGDPGEPACLYTTVPVYRVDEKAMTATLKFQQVIPAAQYSFFGGATTWLPNGNLEYDLCAEPGYTGIVREVTVGAGAKTVWEMTVGNSNVYRANRIPSLYPG